MQEFPLLFLENFGLLVKQWYNISEIFCRENKINLKMKQKGYTLIELLVSVAVFAILTTAFLSAYAALTKSVKLAREKTILSALASERMEIVRNLPFSDVGTIHGVPAGSLPDEISPVTVLIAPVTYKIYYEVTWTDDPADLTALTGDSYPTDYKQVKMKVLNTSTGQITAFTTSVAPQGLETPGNTGVMRVQVFNSTGQPLSGVDVSITGISNGIALSVKTNATGEWVQVGLPPGSNAYHVVATKTGYSTDQTYPLTVQNPNPINPDPTILSGVVTNVPLQIDLLSNLTIKTLDSFCQPLNGIGVQTIGAKTIGTNPVVYKFDQTNVSGPASFPAGQINYTNIEWDTYTPNLTTATLQNYNIRGTSPIQKIDVLPATSQTFSIILTPPSDHSLLVIVKDATTKAPLEGAVVELQKGGSQPQDYFGSTGGSVWVQNDWTGGSGFADWSSSTPTTYWVADPDIYINNGSNDIQLRKSGSKYPVNATSTLQSSTYDTGTGASTFTTITWTPISQDASTTLAIQIAANNDNATWEYVGPDGTTQTFYTVPGTNISSSLNNNRYVRYKVYLSSQNDKKTPALTSINLNYVSGCYTPGQYLFDDITPSNGDAYTLTVTLPGYQTFIDTYQIGGNGTVEILLGK